MSYEVINNSLNPLQMSDGAMLAPVGAKGSKRVMEAVDKRDKSYEERGWISIIEKEESKPAETAAAETKTEVKFDGGNKTK